MLVPASNLAGETLEMLGPMVGDTLIAMPSRPSSPITAEGVFVLSIPTKGE